MYVMPKLKGVKDSDAPHALNCISQETIKKIAGEIVYFQCFGMGEISGDNWASMYASAIGAEHRNSMLGLDDIVLGEIAWSAKTVKGPKDLSSLDMVRLISGRNNVYTSYGLTDILADPQHTGNFVLEIWNSRVRSARRNFADLRLVVLVRGDGDSYMLFEKELQSFAPGEYRWEVNERGNFQCFCRSTGDKRFTWNPSGSQFTILEKVPNTRTVFSVKRPPPLN